MSRQEKQLKRTSTLHTGSNEDENEIMAGSDGTITSVAVAQETANRTGSFRANKSHISKKND